MSDVWLLFNAKISCTYQSFNLVSPKSVSNSRSTVGSSREANNYTRDAVHCTLKENIAITEEDKMFNPDMSQEAMDNCYHVPYCIQNTPLQ